MKFKNIIAASLLLIIPSIVQAKKNAAAQPQNQATTSQQNQTPPSSGQQKSFNGTLINNASQTIQVQFLNISNQPLTAPATLKQKKHLAIPSGAVFINIFVNNIPVIGAPVGAVANHARTALRDLSYVVTNTNGQWNIKMA